MKYGLKAIGGRFGFFEDFVDNQFILEFHTRTGGKGSNLFDKAASEKFGPCGKSRLVGPNIGDFLPIGKLAFGIHWRSLEIFCASIISPVENLGVVQFLAFLGGSVVIPKTTDGIKGFQHISGRIDLLVAAGA